MENNILKTRLTSFTQDYRDFVMSDFTEIAGSEAQNKYRWNDDTRDTFENMLFLYITLFLNRIEFIEAVIVECKMPVSDAMELVATTLTMLPTEMQYAQREANLTLIKNENEPVAETDRFAYLSSLPDQKVAVYLYAKTAPPISSLCQQHGITDETLLDQAHTLIGDIVLGFYKLEDTAPLLQQELGLDGDTAAKLSLEIINFTRPLLAENFSVPNIVATPQTKPFTPEYFQIASVTPTPSSSSHENYAEAQAAMIAETLTPEIRTMAGDMAARSPERTSYEPIAANDEPTYSSKQPEVRSVLSDLPSYTTISSQPTPTTTPPVPTTEPPRWG